MYIESVIIKTSEGLHSHSLDIFLKKAKEYKSTMWLQKNNRTITIQNYLDILALNVNKGEKIEIIADGEDEQLAVAALSKLVKEN